MTLFLPNGSCNRVGGAVSKRQFKQLKKFKQFKKKSQLKQFKGH
jgi:hypothetical protein